MQESLAVLWSPVTSWPWPGRGINTFWVLIYCLERHGHAGHRDRPRPRGDTRLRASVHTTLHNLKGTTGGRFWCFETVSLSLNYPCRQEEDCKCRTSTGLLFCLNRTSRRVHLFCPFLYLKQTSFWHYFYPTSNTAKCTVSVGSALEAHENEVLFKHK